MPGLGAHVLEGVAERQLPVILHPAGARVVAVDLAQDRVRHAPSAYAARPVILPPWRSGLKPQSWVMISQKMPAEFSFENVLLFSIAPLRAT